MGYLDYSDNPSGRKANRHVLGVPYILIISSDLDFAPRSNENHGQNQGGNHNYPKRQ
jgi:hypothetical protein